MEHSTAPHIVALPFPAEGHIKPMFNLTKLLSHRGHRITFVNTNHNQNRLLQFTDLPSFHTQFPDFHFACITDDSRNDFAVIVSPTSRSKVAEEFRELLSSFVEKEKPCCIVADGMMSTIAMDVAQELEIPVIAFRTYSATATWVTIHLSKIIQEGVMDLQHQEDIDKILSSMPGLENVLRDRDLPSVIKMKPGNFGVDFYIKETLSMTQASGLILNTFDELEAPIISKLTTIFPKVYTIGPLHSLIKTQITNNSPSTLHLRKEDRKCITWLDQQNAKSVLYVSFGTVVKLSHEQLLEFWHGLVNSLKPFLWVIRKDLINKDGLDNNVPIEVELGTKERGLLVEWAPQEEVLAHPAVGGFLTHCGWNSTIESIVEGVPMLCWPLIADQTINSRCVSEQWGIGLDMNGTCDRLIVEKMVKNVMENQMKEIISSTNEISEKARDSVKETGSSYHNIENLVQNIRSMSIRK